MDFPRHNRTPVKNACNNALKLTHDLRCDKKVFAAANENESRVSARDAEAFAHRTWFCKSRRNCSGFGSERFKSD